MLEKNRKRLEVKDLNTIEELKKEIRRNTKNGRYSLRLRCVLLRKEGKSTKEIQESLLVSNFIARWWIRRYNEESLKALKYRHTSGKREVWTKKYFEELFEEIDKNRGVWTIKRMQEFIGNIHNVKIPLESIRRKLHQYKYSWKSSKPSPYKGDK